MPIQQISEKSIFALVIDYYYLCNKNCLIREYRCKHREGSVSKSLPLILFSSDYQIYILDSHFCYQNTCPVGKTDTEHAAGNVPSMSSSFAAKIRLSRGQKQIYLYFAEAEYLRRSQRLGLSFGKICFCRSGTESKIRKAERKRELVHSFPGRILSSTKIDAGLHVKISGPKSYPSPSKYNPRQNKIGLFDRGVISRCAA